MGGSFSSETMVWHNFIVIGRLLLKPTGHPCFRLTMGGSFSRPDVTGPEKRRTSTSDDEKATATLPATSTSASASTSTDTEIRGQKIGLSLKGQQHASARTSKYFIFGGGGKILVELSRPSCVFNRKTYS